HAVHADAPEGLGHRGQRADDLIIAAAADLVQRPGTVLAGRPGDQRFRPHAHRPAVVVKALIAASAARSPDSQAPPTVPHSVSWVASPAENRRLLSGSVSALRAPWPPGAAAEKAPST